METYITYLNIYPGIFIKVATTKKSGCVPEFVRFFPAIPQRHTRSPSTCTLEQKLAEEVHHLQDVKKKILAILDANYSHPMWIGCGAVIFSFQRLLLYFLLQSIFY
jgi:hypothetical protein